MYSYCLNVFLQYTTVHIYLGMAVIVGLNLNKLVVTIPYVYFMLQWRKWNKHSYNMVRYVVVLSNV